MCVARAVSARAPPFPISPKIPRSPHLASLSRSDALADSSNPFCKDAITALLANMTDPRYKGKMLIIFAGYEKDINDLLSSNEGLRSRVTEELVFKAWEPAHCCALTTRASVRAWAEPSTLGSFLTPSCPHLFPQCRCYASLLPIRSRPLSCPTSLMRRCLRVFATSRRASAGPTRVPQDVGRA